MNGKHAHDASLALACVPFASLHPLSFLTLLPCAFAMSGLATDKLVTEVEDKLAGLDSYEQLLGGIAQGGGVAAL